MKSFSIIVFDESLEKEVGEIGKYELTRWVNMPRFYSGADINITRVALTSQGSNAGCSHCNISGIKLQYQQCSH